MSPAQKQAQEEKEIKVRCKITAYVQERGHKKCMCNAQMF